jgi:hypothetical protein
VIFSVFLCTIHNDNVTHYVVRRLMTGGSFRWRMTVCDDRIGRCHSCQTHSCTSWEIRAVDRSVWILLFIPVTRCTLKIHAH